MAEKFDVSEKLSGIPIEDLICHPFVKVAEAQRELHRVYVENIFDLAYENSEVNGKTNIIKFNISKPVLNDEGYISQNEFQIGVPLLSLVSVSAFTMDSMSIDFTIDVKDQVTKANPEYLKAKTNDYVSRRRPRNMLLTGKITSNNDGKIINDHTAKYVIKASASRQPVTGGMSKITELFNSMIEPITLSKSKGN